MPNDAETIAKEITSCCLCARRFAETATAHAPRPVAWFGPGARILIAGQAPGNLVHETGIPFNDPSGDRLREWLAIEPETFYDRTRVAILPMAFCFPGYDAKGSDLPPPPICAETWREKVLAALPRANLTLLIGGYAQKWHLGGMAKGGVTETVRRWRDMPEGVIPLPHPSWRNSGWLKRNPWFEDEVLPVLREKVETVLQ